MIEYHFGRNRLKRWRLSVGKVVLCSFVLGTVFSEPGYAIVGQAEKFDEFQEDELKEYHSTVLEEERMRRLEESIVEDDEEDEEGEDSADEDVAQGEEGDSEMSDEEKRKIQQAQAAVDALSQKKVQADREELRLLREELLSVPKKDRFRFGFEFDYDFDSNVTRAVSGSEVSDHVVDTGAFVEFDLGGLKTDIRSEWRAERQWNVVLSENDSYQGSHRLRYRRKYFKKLQQSFQSLITRNSERTVEIDNRKIRWDANNQSTFNLDVSRRLSVGLDTNLIHRMFLQEAFDQDSSHQITLTPSASWKLTPKSRLNFGYTFGASRIRTKSGDSNEHAVRTGYFGRITRKSSMSLDLAFSHQVPRSLETSEVNTFTAGIGYIYQITPKTQITIQLIRQLQNSTSEAVVTSEDDEVTDETVTTKTDSFFTNDNISIGVNAALTKRVSGNLSVGASHLRTEVEEGGDETQTTRQFTFPMTLQFDIIVTKWLTATLGYGFTWRFGNNKEDSFREHNVISSMALNF